MALGVPILKGTTATAAPAFIDFTSCIGWVLLVNKSNTESIWIAFDALPGGTTTADGRFELRPNQRLVLGGIICRAIGIQTPVNPAEIDAIGLE